MKKRADKRNLMSGGEKLIILIGGSLFYIPGYFFLFKEIRKADYSLASVVFGSLFTGFGLLLHSAILFEKQWNALQRNKRFMCVGKYTLKLIGTLITLPIGIFLVYMTFTEKPDNYKAGDLKLIKGTVSKKPEFEKGGKSSTYLNIYLKEYSGYCFEPRYNRFVHYNTNFEEETNIGDTIILGIFKEDFGKYISKTVPLSYFEQHDDHHGYIQVYYIESKSAVYYNPEVHNLMDKEDKEWSWVGFVIAVPVLLAWISIWHRDLVALLLKLKWQKAAGALIRLRERKIL